MYPDMSKLTDVELIENCIKGNNDYFAPLVSRYKNLVYSVVLRMTSNSDEANDLAQEVFIKVYKNLEKYNSEFKFSTWIMRITTNHVIDSRRKKHFETTNISDLEVEIATDDNPEKVFLEKETKSELKTVVDQLPEMYRLPIVLYHQQGMSYQEISEIIEEPLSKVKNRIFRGRKLLKESLLKLREGGNYGL